MTIPTNRIHLLKASGSVPRGERREDNGPYRFYPFVNSVRPTPVLPGPAKP